MNRFPGFNISGEDWKRIQLGLMPAFVGLGISHKRLKLSGKGTRLQQLDPKQVICSGFVMVYRDCWYYVTAGHVFEEFNAAEQFGRENFQFSLVDGFSDFDKQVGRVPIPYKKKEWLSVFDEETGVDLAVHILSSYEKRLLVAGGVKPLNANALSTELDYDCYAILGLPSELAEDTVRDKGSTRYSQLSLGLPMLRAWPDFEKTPHQQNTDSVMYAKIETLSGIFDGKPSELHDIKGMSGGPVVGLSFSGSSVTQKVIGVQSHWDQKAKVVRVSLLSPLLDFIDSELAKVDFEEKSSDSDPVSSAGIA